VPYIICVARNEDGSIVEASGGLAERAYHPEEVNGNPKLTVDVNYYLSNQAIHLPLRQNWRGKEEYVWQLIEEVEGFLMEV
jgi:hypothetical protein